MLICTNDGFVGLNNVRLPQGFRTIMRRGHAYDAGTELNDELFTSIVDPCGAIGPVAAPADGLNDRTATPDEVVRMHRGIRGGGDLFPDDHGWEGPAAKITIRRIPMERIYRVSIENLTSSQPFSPGVVATHVARSSVVSTASESPDRAETLPASFQAPGELVPRTGTAQNNGCRNPHPPSPWECALEFVRVAAPGWSGSRSPGLQTFGALVMLPSPTLFELNTAGRTS